MAIGTYLKKELVSNLAHTYMIEAEDQTGRKLVWNIIWHGLHIFLCMSLSPILFRSWCEMD